MTSPGRIHDVTGSCGVQDPEGQTNGQMGGAVARQRGLTLSSAVSYPLTFQGKYSGAAQRPSGPVDA